MKDHHKPDTSPPASQTQASTQNPAHPPASPEAIELQRAEWDRTNVGERFEPQ